ESAKYETRPELIRMLEVCRKSKGNITHCIVWKVDRLARNTNVHSAIRVQLARNGVKLESVTEPIDNDPLGRAMEGILAVFAQLDNDMRTQRTTGGMKTRTEEGGWPHDAPYGYSKDRTPSGASSIKPNDDAPLAKKF